MFDELRSLDVDASCENLEITIFSEAVEFTQAHCGSVDPLLIVKSVWVVRCMC